MGWSHLGVLVLGLCCAAPVVWGQGYVNIARWKAYNQSSTSGSSLASNAADGSTTSSFRSSNENNNFWEVDLGRTYPVHKINVWGCYSRSSDSYLYPYTITVDGQHCVTVSPRSTSVRNHSVTCSSPLYGQKVRLTKHYNGNELCLSEFEILVPSGVSQCYAGRWGSGCQNNCSNNCGSGAGNNFCYQSTGQCYGECVAGRWGDRCEYRCGQNCATGNCDMRTGHCSACLPGRYGNQCDRNCSSQSCLLNMCDQGSGRCLACTTGYDGYNCTECKAGYYRSGDSCYPCSSLCASSHCHPSNGSCIGCVDGRHGATCNTTCSPAGCQTCHQHSGQCTACKPLYNLDPTSQCKECKVGFSKHNSSTCSPCSASCEDRKCNGDTGDCTQGCRPGYHGQQCEESCSTLTDQCVQCTQKGQCTACSGHFIHPDCTACREGFYRKTEGADHCTECTWTCHNSTFCNNMTGACDRCPSGREGPRCLQRVKNESSQQSVVGAILGAGLMLTVAVLSVLVFLCWKHRSQKTVQDAEPVAASSSDPVTAPSNVYTAPPTASPSTSASAQASDVTPHEIRDPGNTYEQLRIYSNMVFDREAHSDPEPRGTDVTTALSTSEHVHVSVEHIYANTSSATEERKLRKKKAK